jgi:hypothetical protein
MSEIYPSVRTSIRNSVLQALYERPGAWLSTHDLLDLVEEAESSGILARILSDMAATGRLAKGPKTQNANGQSCNTWGLSPEWRGRLSVEHTWQDHTGQVAAEAPPLPVESREDEAPAPPISQPTAEDSSGPDPSYAPLHKLQPSTAPPRAPATARPVPAIGDYPALNPPFAWGLAEPDQPHETPPSNHATCTDIHYHPLPERWLPELRLRLLATDGGGDPIITLRINTDGGGAFLTLSTRGQIAFDPGELDFLPSIGTALCQFIDALYPYGATRPTAAATTPSAPDQP